MQVTMPLDLTYPNTQINAVIDSQEIVVVLQWNTSIQEFTFSFLSPAGEVLLGSLLLIQDFNLIEDFSNFQGSLIFNGSELIWSGDE